MSRTVSALLSVAMSGLVACATVQPVGLDWGGVPAEVRQTPVKVLVYGPADAFQLMTPGDVAGAGLVDAFTRPDGSSLDLPNPAYLLGLALRQQLSDGGKLLLGEVPNVIAADRAPRGGYVPGTAVLEVSIDLSYLSYKPLAWTTYEYRLDAHARLLDAGGKTLWQNKCAVRNGTETPLQLARGEFAQDDGQKLKGILQRAAERCAAEIAP